MSGLWWAVRRWWADLAFGVRLAVGSGRSPWGRLALTAVGIGLGAAVLLAASSVQAISQSSNERVSARTVNILDRDGESPALLAMTGNTEFQGERVKLMLLDPQIPDAPTPPGVSRLPGPGEAVISPEVARLLASPEGAQLRPRLGERVVGVIGDEGLQSPGELLVYQGTDELTRADTSQGVYHHFGEGLPDLEPLDPQLRILLVLGVTALLVPVIVFISATSRFAENIRQRRLAALRLVGASGRQVGRIASGEALIGSVFGVALGWILYLVARTIATSGPTSLALYPSDVQPTWWCAALVTMGIPVIAVATAVASMRRTVIEPLGVVRQTATKPRKLAWRCIPIAVGVVTLLIAGALPEEPYPTTWSVASVVLILAGVPLLLPWVVERGVRFLGRGSISWQLAVRRLQLTSGTAARSVSAIAVVLTGVIALQTTVASAASARVEAVEQQGKDLHGPVSFDVAGSARKGSSADEVVRDLKAQPGVTSAKAFRLIDLVDAHGERTSAVVLDCTTLREITALDRCGERDAFFVSPDGQRNPRIHGGIWQTLSYASELDSLDVRVPPVRGLALRDETLSLVRSARFHEGMLVLTPELVAGVPEQLFVQRVSLQLDASSGVLEQVRNVAAEHLHLPSVQPTSLTLDDTEATGELFRGVQYALLIGALITFGLITCGLFVTAAEQVQERRRPMAVLGAVGTRPSELARSLLLQNALPMLAAIVVSVVLGLLLGLLMVMLIGSPRFFSVDIAGMVGLVGIAVVSVLVVTGLTLPVVGRAMRPEWLRTE